jgi:hypothetical protein
LREAKAKLQQALEAVHNSELNIDLLARQIQAATKRAMDDEEELERKLEEEEKLQRSARKMVLAAKWNGVASPTPVKLLPSTPNRMICPTSPIRTPNHNSTNNKLFPVSPTRALTFPLM